MAYTPAELIKRIEDRAVLARQEKVLEKAVELRKKAKPGTGPKSSPRDFDGLPEKPLSQCLANANLTEMQLKCARLKCDYGLPTAEIARRLRRSRATIQGRLNAALRKIDNPCSKGRKAKGIKSPPQ